MEILKFEKVVKGYSPDSQALKGISFTLGKGEFTALAGPSGSGKTTLLNLAAGLDFATSGMVSFMGRDLSKFNADSLCQIRSHYMGFVFQAYNLLPVLTVLENVEYPLALNGAPRSERRKRALEVLEEVGLGKFAKRFPNQLSGGQQQRVAIARALATEPKIIFADEPTANLDSTTAKDLLRLFQELNQNKGMTFLFSSHDPMVLSAAKRVLKISDGQIQGDSGQGTELSEEILVERRAA